VFSTAAGSKQAGAIILMQMPGATFPTGICKRIIY
jgi:hypothetical protein